MGDNRRLAPTSIDDYIAVGGYCVLAQVLTSMAPEAVIEEITASGLRGRGGGGYPTGKKWAQTRRRGRRCPLRHLQRRRRRPRRLHGPRRCSRAIPHSILEGHADRRVRRRRAARATCTSATSTPWPSRTSARPSSRRGSCGLLGESILGTEFSFDVKVARGGGAFVCGESTALMASLAGRGGRAPGQGRPHRRARLSGSADRPQQRRDLGQRAADHPARERPGSPPRARRRARAPRSSRSPVT